MKKDGQKREDEIKKKEKMRKALIKQEHEKRDENKKRYLAGQELLAKEERDKRREYLSHGGRSLMRRELPVLRSGRRR